MPVWHGIKMSRKRGDRAFLGGRRGAVEGAFELVTLLLFIRVLRYHIHINTHAHVLYTLKIFKTCNYTQTSLQTCHAQIAFESLFCTMLFFGNQLCTKPCSKLGNPSCKKRLLVAILRVRDCVFCAQTFTLRAPSCSDSEP